MNKLFYKLVFDKKTGAFIACAECVKSTGKGTKKVGNSLALRKLLVVGAIISGSSAVQAELPQQRLINFATAGQATYIQQGQNAFVNQIGNKSILNWTSFNISKGNSVTFQQVDANNNLVSGANFISLNRIYDSNPSVIAGAIRSAPGQTANVTLVNQNGIAFLNGAQVNLGSFTASSLDIKDHFITDSFLPGDGIPQFVGTGGFVKVFEGASITSGSQGRVMLFAPTVVNKGAISSPEGQILLAAASTVYLQASGTDDPNVRGLVVQINTPSNVVSAGVNNPSIGNGTLDASAISLKDAPYDKLGMATNSGQLSSNHGNITMVGYAVNQMGLAHATTSVVANGSIYLLAKDQAISTDSGTVFGTGASRSGQINFGSQSVTEVVPDVNDRTTSIDSSVTTNGVTTYNHGLANKSQVLAVGQKIHLEGGANINAASGNVQLIAVDDPSSGSPAQSIPTSLTNGILNASSNAVLQVDSGANISVAGLQDVPVSVSRNVVTIQLRGDELKDSPINQSTSGPIRGQSVNIDVVKALANANAGKNTLVAIDSLNSYVGQIQRNVSERSISGGSISLQSQGQNIVENGSILNVSGGSIKYTPSTVDTTYLISNGNKLTSVADALSTIRYSGLATKFVTNYAKWGGRQDIYNTSPLLTYLGGYTEGASAGNINVIGSGAIYFQPNIIGNTITGDKQKLSQTQPAGAALTFGYYDSVGLSNRASLGYLSFDYRINQNIVISNNVDIIPSAFGFGDLLPQPLEQSLDINASEFIRNGIQNITIFNNKSVTIADNINLAPSGSIRIRADGIKVNGNLTIPSGSVNLYSTTNYNNFATLPPVNTTTQISLADNVAINLNGKWINNFIDDGAYDTRALNGGSFVAVSETVASSGQILSDGNFTFGAGAKIDVGGGALIDNKKKITAGAGGSIKLEADHILGFNGALSGYGVQKATSGSLSITAGNLTISDTDKSTPSTLVLPSSFLSTGGFGSFALGAYDKLTLAENTGINASVTRLVLNTKAYTYASSDSISALSDINSLNYYGAPAFSLTLNAAQKGRGLGTVILGSGSAINLGAAGTLNISAINEIEFLGGITAAGGSITATVSTAGVKAGAPLGNIWIGSSAKLDLSGDAVTYVDPNGLLRGAVLDGGTVNLTASGLIVSQTDSIIDVSGKKNNTINYAGALPGHTIEVYSNAGSITEFANSGALLDGTVVGRGNRGGSFNFTLGKYVPSNDVGQTNTTLLLSNTVDGTTKELIPGTRLSVGDLLAANIGVSDIIKGGFESFSFSSRDAIALDKGLQFASNGALPLINIRLDSGRLQAYGNAFLSSQNIEIGNYDPIRVVQTGGTPAVVNNLEMHAEQFELFGATVFDGITKATFSGLSDQGKQTYAKAVNLNSLPGISGIPAGSFQTTGDVTFNADEVVPSSYVNYTIDATGHQVAFHSSVLPQSQSLPPMPLSAFGNLTINADQITQAGTIWAPFGSIEFNADTQVTFLAGSLTSVSGVAGQTIPFGQTENGTNWVYKANPADPVNGTLQVPTLPQKSIVFKSKKIDMQSGSKVDITGGGDIFAYEFTVGPGGSKDILTNVPNATTGKYSAITYAIVPSYILPTAPFDSQEFSSFVQGASGGRITPGTSINLSGVAGLPDGNYTLLPAHYALLPGAYAVVIPTNSKVLLPNQAYSNAEGIQVVSAQISDSRTSAPQGSSPIAVTVYNQKQILERSQISETSGSEFFKNTSGTHVSDAGLLSIATTASPGTIRLDSTFLAKPSAGGIGAEVDISAANLSIVTNQPLIPAPNTTYITIDALNNVGAQSIILGAKSESSLSDVNSKTLIVGSNVVSVNGDATHPLHAPEIVIASNDLIDLGANTQLVADGAVPPTRNYNIVTPGAAGSFVRVASGLSTQSHSFAPNTANPIPGAGNLTAGPGVKLEASSYIALDASTNNNYNGLISFASAGAAVAGNLSVSAPQISFNAPTVLGNIYNVSKTQLAALNNLNTALFTSYTGFDLYGGVNIGSYTSGASNSGINVLTLDGAYINGIANNGQTSIVAAKNLILRNTRGIQSTSPITMGTGSIQFNGATLTLADGAKNVVGFSDVQVNASDLLIANIGSWTIGNDQMASLNMNVDRVKADSMASQSIKTSSALSVSKLNSGIRLPSSLSLGANLSLEGSSVAVDSSIVLNSGTFKAHADQGDVLIGPSALIDVSGVTAQFFDATKSTWGGTAEFTSDKGSVSLLDGASVNVSGGPSESGGNLKINAANGRASLGSNSVYGMAGTNTTTNTNIVTGSNIVIDANLLDNFSELNAILNAGGFTGNRDIRVRGVNKPGDNSLNDITVQSTDIIQATNISLEADNGSVNIHGYLNASGNQGGTVNISASQGVLMSGSAAAIDVSSTGPGKKGGTVSITAISTAANALNLQSGTINVGGGAGDVNGTGAGDDGSLVLTLTRNNANPAQLNLAPINSIINGKNANINIIFNKIYTNVGYLTATGAAIQGSPTAPGQVLLTDIFADNLILDGKTSQILQRVNSSGNPKANIVDGAVIQSAALDITNGYGNLTLLSGDDWEMGSFLRNPGGNTGSLVLRSAGNININSNLSDGFDSSLATSARLASNNSWSYTMVAGADLGASSFTRVDANLPSNTGNINLAAGQLIRTGTGNISLNAANNISLGDTQSVIYTAGKLAPVLPGFTLPYAGYKPLFTYDGGDVSLTAGGNINGVASTQLFNEWLFRQGQTSSTSGLYAVINLGTTSRPRLSAPQQTAWWVRFDQFQEGIGALGGGNVSVNAGKNIYDLSVNVPSQGRVSGLDPASASLTILNTGNLMIGAGGNIVGGQYYSDQGNIILNAGGSIMPSSTVLNSNTQGIGSVIGIGSGMAQLRAVGDLDVSSVVNPFLLAQSNLNLAPARNIPVPRSEFTTFTANTSINLASLGGSVSVHQSGDLSFSYGLIKSGNDSTSVNMQNNIYMFPPALSVVSYDGGITMGAVTDDVTMYSSPFGKLNLLASSDIKFNSMWVLADSFSTLLPTPLKPALVSVGTASAPLLLPAIIKNEVYPSIVDHAATPVHVDNFVTSEIYSNNGSVQGIYNINSLNFIGGVDSSTSLNVEAALDIKDFNAIIQQTSSSQTSSLVAGRDILMEGIARRDNLKIWIDGPGDLTVTAGRNINLGTSGGIESRGALDNPNLPSGGANIHLNAGTGSAGLDYTGTLSRISSALKANPSDATSLWEAQLLVGQVFNSAADAIAGINQLKALPEFQQVSAVRKMVFQALSTTGLDHNDPKSAFYGDYSRGYAVLDLVFPGLSTAGTSGKYDAYNGYINLFASRVKTNSGGDIDFMIPGGGLTVGLANTPQALVGSDVLNNNVLGVVVAGAGKIEGFAKDSMLVNQSRILTVGGGDVLLWSSEGDIDAGKGKKSASAVPPPLIVVDANGNVKQVLQGAVGGSGIGALSSGSAPAGNVDLIAPKGTVNAGDAGIRAGNINIAAQTVLGADNISVSGTSAGVPLADTSAVSAAAAGGATAGDLNKTLSSIASAASDAASAGQALANALKPTIVRVEVLGFGEQSN